MTSSSRKNKTYEEFYGIERAREIKNKMSERKKIIDLINKYNLPYKYTGDGSFLIGYKNPDFINVNGEKIAIGVYNRYHKKLIYNSFENYEKKRKEHFSKYGWKTIFMNDKDIKDENLILNKIGGIL